MPRIEFKIAPDGTAKALYDAGLSDIVEQIPGMRVERLTHVEPVNGLLRLLFHTVRKVCGEDGRLGDWTRTWCCDWRINFGPIGGDIRNCDTDGCRFTTRQAAIDYELKVVHHYLQGGSLPCSY